MEGGKALGVRDIDFFAGFEIENDFVLGAVIFEHAADVFEPGERVEEPDEDSEPDDAIGEIVENLAFKAGTWF